MDNRFKNNEFQIMQDAWKVYTKYYEGSNPDDDRFWDMCVKEFLEIQTKYKTDFAKNVVEVFLNDIDERSRKIRR